QETQWTQKMRKRQRVKPGHGVHFFELEGWFSGKRQEKNISSIVFQLKGFGVCVPLAPLAPFALNGSEDVDALALGPAPTAGLRDQAEIPRLRSG
ncbi:MAG TPA: hypothetical protein PLJ99_09330, partial [Kiritimatiellia bacterium]|nr:hypothetical protein [Kiritimatiellia bacterium]